jgi:hypothetical protein
MDDLYKKYIQFALARSIEFSLQLVDINLYFFSVSQFQCLKRDSKWSGKVNFFRYLLLFAEHFHLRFFFKMRTFDVAL